MNHSLVVQAATKTSSTSQTWWFVTLTAAVTLGYNSPLPLTAVCDRDRCGSGGWWGLPVATGCYTALGTISIVVLVSWYQEVLEEV